MSYNGWIDYETWNTALWLSNDEFLYNYTRELFWRENSLDDVVHVLMNSLADMGEGKTGDGVEWRSDRIRAALESDWQEFLDELEKELTET